MNYILTYFVKNNNDWDRVSRQLTEDEIKQFKENKSEMVLSQFPDLKNTVVAHVTIEEKPEQSTSKRVKIDKRPYFRKFEKR